MIEVTWKKTQDAQVSGPCQPTSVNEEKSRADFRIIDASGGSYTLRANEHVDFELSGVGIVGRSTGGTYEVTSKALDRLSMLYLIVPDF